VLQKCLTTTTLVEGVNLPADNLFITSYRNGIAQMTPVDFNNLIGRVGRIEYNLYGNVFLVCLPGSKNDKDKFVELLNKDVPAQQLSLVTELTVAQKKLIVECLCDGNVELMRHPKNQTANSYALMRKFAIILLRDIMKNRNSIVKREFEPYLTNGEASKIKEVFNKSENKP
jgi:replicative superfamily II helicase